MSKGTCRMCPHWKQHSHKVGYCMIDIKTAEDGNPIMREPINLCFTYWKEKTEELKKLKKDTIENIKHCNTGLTSSYVNFL